MAADFNHKPDQQPADRSTELMVDSVVFGGGYKQDTPKAPNNAERTWTLTYTRDVATIKAMEAELKAFGGYLPFTIDDPDTDPAILVTVKVTRMRVSPKSGTRERLTATFREAQWSSAA